MATACKNPFHANNLIFLFIMWLIWLYGSEFRPYHNTMSWSSSCYIFLCSFYSLIWNSKIYTRSKNTCTFKFLDKNIYFICYENSIDAPTWTEQTLKIWHNIMLMATSISRRVPKQQVPCRTPTAQLSIKGHLWAFRFQFLIETTNITASRLILYHAPTAATKLERF